MSERPSAEHSALAGSSALVTGGAGFIGSHLVDRLLAEGVATVHVIDDLSLGKRDNLSGALEHPAVQLTVGDAADLELLQGLAGEFGRFDYCFNMAVIPLPHSLRLPRENVDRNVAITTAVCELGRAGGYRRLMHCSSSEVYGTALTVPMDEEHPLHPHTPYAAAKAATDLIALSYATTFELEVVVIRPFNTYGERQNDQAYAGLIPAVVNAVLAREPIIIDGDGEQTRDLAYVADTVSGLIQATRTPGLGGESFNLGSGKEASVNETVRLLLRALERPDHPVVHGPARAGDVRRLVADTNLARRRFGYAPATPLNVGLTRTVNWYVGRARRVRA